jgi:NADH:ubiquinone oxidoreductase subunit
MGLLSPITNLLGVLSPIHIHFVTLVTGANRVGTDPYGNKYYRCKARKGYKHDRRWVIFKGEAEASAVPPEWHGWLHHQTDEVPDENAQSFRRLWQKPHQPNRTGTTLAYRPPGHVLSGGQRDKATGDYEAWTPD